MLDDVGFEVLDPWTLTSKVLFGKAERVMSVYGQRTLFRKADMAAGENNFHAIKRCRAIAAALDGQDVDSGTASEIGCGFALGKTVIGYRGDFRLSSENPGTVVNMQVEYFIRASGGDIYTDLKSLRKAMIRLHERLSSADRRS